MNDQKKPYVLVAEDVRAIALTITYSLESAGMEVKVVGDGEACLDSISQRCPDLVILDLMMPKMHGIDVLKALRSDPQTQELPVLVCTSKQFSTEMRQVEELGAVGSITKPFECQQLVTTVQQHLAKLLSPEGEADNGVHETQGTPSSEDQGSEQEGVFLPHPDPTQLNFRLWGTRGSIPVSGARYVRHGGNTSCMSIELENDVVIFDAGSGIRDLGNLIACTNKTIRLFITHTHWDHIQGFPFFTPAYVSSAKIIVYGEHGFGKNLQSVLLGQLDRDYFPVQFQDMQADFQFEYLTDEPVVVGDATISREYVNHPGATVGYRIDIGDKSLVYISDNEFLQGYHGAPCALGNDHPEIMPHQKTLDFASGADILLHEAQYTNEEYIKKVGWGHSCLSNACLFAKIAAPKHWVVLHHDPLHDDEFLDRKLDLTRDILASIQCDVRVDHGFDGMALRL